MKKLITIFISLLFTATFLSAETITVTSGADSGAGTLREAITNAESGDTIIFADNVTTIYFAGIIELDKNITISGNETNNTIFQNADIWTDNAGNRKRYFFILANAEVTLNYLTLKDNIGNCGGGAINNAGNLTLNSCIFDNNRAYDTSGAVMSSGNLIVSNCAFINNVAPIGSGGAISCRGEATITNSRFTGNRSSSGGGAVYINSDATVFISNCTFEENTAQYGGAINNWGTTIIDNCTFKKNKTNQRGGAISNNGTTIGGNSTRLNVSSCIFYQNEAVSSGILYNNAKATISNCLFYKNIADIILNEGLASNPAVLTLINSTITDNTGFGLYNSNVSGHNRVGYATLQNNIFSNNTNDDVYAENVSETNIIASNNLIGISNIDLIGNGNIIGGDPLFVGNGDYSLQAESPAIDKGNNTYLPAEITRDLAGNPRINNVTVDMGAYEYQQEPITSLAKNSLNEQLKVYVRNRTIIIENAVELVSIYSLPGVRVAQGTKTEYTMPQAGVYVVKVGETVRKVVVRP